MNRVAIVAAACAVACAAAPAAAATQIQTNSTISPTAFRQFDPSRGTLTAVQLEVSVTATRYYDLFGSSNEPAVVPFGYTIAGNYRVTLFSDILLVPLDVSGTKPVTLTPTTNGPAVGSTMVYIPASASFDLDPSKFIGTNQFIAIGRDTGYFAPNGIAADTQISAPGTSGVVQTQRNDSDFAANGNFRLIYTYTPSFANGVPEPSTWGMLLAGFGVLGFAMRRRAGPNSTVSALGQRSVIAPAMS